MVGVETAKRSMGTIIIKEHRRNCRLGQAEKSVVAKYGFIVEGIMEYFLERLSLLHQLPDTTVDMYDKQLRKEKTSGL